MTTTSREGATIYYQVDTTTPDVERFAGTFNGEILNEGEEGYLPHLAPGFREEKGGTRLSKEGLGDVVIAGISREGWAEVTRVLDSLTPDATRAQIEDAIIEQLPWITVPREKNEN